MSAVFAYYKRTLAASHRYRDSDFDMKLHESHDMYLYVAKNYNNLSTFTRHSYSVNDHLFQSLAVQLMDIVNKEKYHMYAGKREYATGVAVLTFIQMYGVQNVNKRVNKQNTYFF